MITKEQVIEILKTIKDPELDLDVWTLGLIYDISVTDGKDIYMIMTFTTPLCPYGTEMAGTIKEKIVKNLKPKSLKIEVTFDPPWEPSEGLREMLGV
ncbi:MAG: aromatic ring hydroxylase [Candidatus Ryanbacteria bacterium CG10_big_fil_rev_8_21_14_0_10_43_42]|uniref:Aromatic ring hydroxylase n=1 Tax=Candidatus Ryanbacteria bacterium CG10_big_fil_rev_8_21_14_0_10_43_42 TaxID=1974864 RepID=A0A2M8KWN0_9BACT|nr:MAG: aromatic ring hydroxylase [Candidatus Ryanbacteria bacterium CG10_big_fil_rev_8_21_14_0_10_43_42]